MNEAYALGEISDRAICIDRDIGMLLSVALSDSPKIQTTSKTAKGVFLSRFRVYRKR